MSRNDGEWWLRGLPMPRGPSEHPSQARVFGLVRGGLTAFAFVSGWDHFGFFPGLVWGTAAAVLVASIEAAWLRQHRWAWQYVVILIGPLLYMLGTLAYRGNDAGRHHLETAGLLLFGVSLVAIAATKQWLASKP